MTIGIVGLGRMGAAMATRLSATGRHVLGWNRSNRVVDGVAIVATLAELAASTDVIILSLHDSAAVREVCSERSGLLTQDFAGKLIIDTSTVSPQTSVDVSRTIARAGGRFVDAPVLGTVTPALNGQLVAMIGGEAADVAEASAVLAPLTKAVHAMGSTGSGSAAKLCVNLVMGSYWAALGDALALGAAYSIPAASLLDIIGAGPAALAQLAAKRSVLDGVAGRVDFALASYVKDLETMREAAGGRLWLPIIDGALASFGRAVSDGWGEQDVVAIALHGARKGADAAAHSDVASLG